MRDFGEVLKGLGLRVACSHHWALRGDSGRTETTDIAKLDSISVGDGRCGVCGG